MGAVEMVEIWRGPFRESVHCGHAVICDAAGQVVRTWGDAEKLVLPRSSAKMIQALPLVESGAADAFGLTGAHLALACASHSGAAIHTDRVAAWLGSLGLSDDDLRCGPQEPSDPSAYRQLLCSDTAPCQRHNNCSGKHAGFLTLGRHLGAGPEYIDPAHPVQRAVLAAWEDLTGAPCPGHAIDGCSAPNFAATLSGVARAMGTFAGARARSGKRAAAQARLVGAMMAHPELVAGEGRACTVLMRRMAGRAAIKTGAEGVYVAILPGPGLGVALKIEDGGTRAAECAIAAILASLGVLDPRDADAQALLAPRILNRRGIDTGQMRPAPGVFD